MQKKIQFLIYLVNTNRRGFERKILLSLKKT